MTGLSKIGLLELLKSDSPLVGDVVDEETQLQVNGFELTVQNVERFENQGAVDFDNSGRFIPPTSEIPWGEDEWMELPPGAYKVVFNEIVDIPKDVMALGLPRSSLLRCGVTLETAVWDAGYRGRSESMLVVYNPQGFRLKKDARILQLIFFRLDHSLDEGYSGIYQDENL